MCIPRPEYPRPSLMRGEDTWINLNGTWSFEIDRANSGKQRGLQNQTQYAGEIIVPFVPESAASGVEDIDFMQRVWYCRTFELPERFDTTKGRVLLHIGAMDYEGEVWINGNAAGSHKGGYAPVSFDITELLHNGENRINITVEDSLRTPLQPSGKQCEQYHPYACFYTRCTGIWQTVWLEYVPTIYIQKVKMLPDVKGEKVDVQVTVSGAAQVRAVVTYQGDPVAEGGVIATGGTAVFSLTIADPVLWGPGEPNLYDIVLTAGEDQVVSYFGMRSVEVDGNRVLINGKPLFQRLVLDQGYYPDGIYTALDRAAFSQDIRLCMDSGFNGARMHMKVFEPGFIWEADHAGYLLWGEYPNWGLDITRHEAMGIMLPEWLEIIERDCNSPAIIGWCPFNESFPGTNTVIYDMVYKITKLFDPTRLVLDTSGYVHAGQTDIYDVHDYEQNPQIFAEHYAPLLKGEAPYFNDLGGNIGYDGKLPFFVSEFGGAFFDIDAVAQNDGQNSGNPWGYGDAPRTSEDLYQRFAELCTVLLDNPYICGLCYTQFTDVEQEMNGLFAFDRRPKIAVEKLRAVLERKAAIEKEF
ncbi:MAG: beta-galactosidase [Clostridiales bacterium]|jgi:beta-galactosidase/beta-glucuronidase|nr:beta-galactosidase [Clostridiales bacterium]